MDKTLNITARVTGDNGRLGQVVMTLRAGTKDEPDAFRDPEGNRHSAVALQVFDEANPVSAILGVPFITDDIGDLTDIRDAIDAVIVARKAEVAA